MPSGTSFHYFSYIKTPSTSPVIDQAPPLPPPSQPPTYSQTFSASETPGNTISGKLSCAIKPCTSNRPVNFACVNTKGSMCAAHCRANGGCALPYHHLTQAKSSGSAVSNLSVISTQVSVSTQNTNPLTASGPMPPPLPITSTAPSHSHNDLLSLSSSTDIPLANIRYKQQM